MAEHKKYRISGNVIDSTTHKGIGQLKIEAWNKIKNQYHSLGRPDLTGNDGEFEFYFKETELLNYFRPEPVKGLFFRVFRDKEPMPIKDTENEVVWNISDGDAKKTIEVDIPPVEVPASKPREKREAKKTVTIDTVEKRIEKEIIEERKMEEEKMIEQKKPEASEELKQSQKEVQMGELDSSKRSLSQAIYTPIKAPEGIKWQRAWEKWSFVASLMPSLTELALLKRHFEEAQKRLDVIDLSVEKVLKCIEIMESTIPQLGTHNALRSVTRFRDTEPDTLISVAKGLIVLRQEQFNSAKKAQKTMLEAVYKVQPPEEPPKLPKAEAKIPAEVTNVKTLMDWAIKNNIESDSAVKMLELIEHLPMRADVMRLADFNNLVPRYFDHLNDLVDGFSQRMLIEPVGFLHLERLSFIPAGIERGELKYSVPLSPDEEVNIAHKEWSNTSEEFEKIVTDFTEAFSEEGVTEKSELSQATNSQEQHSSGFNTGVTASGGYGTVNITASVGYNVAESANNSEQFSRNQSNTITRNASSRVKKEHKISFKVASAAGTEDQQVRRIKNPFQDRATRVDYYQLIRKWKVNLYRYGIRLTYDLNIPEPGLDIISRIKEIKDISAALEQGFGFDLKPGDITPDNYTEIAAKYDATVEPPPPLNKQIVKYETREWKTEEEAKYFEYTAIEVNVPEDYTIISATGTQHGEVFLGHRGAGEWNYSVTPALKLDTDPGPPTDISDWVGKSGKFPIFVLTRYISTFYVKVDIQAEIRAEVLKAWQFKAWTTIRDAAHARYEENRQMLKERLAKLQEELGAQDALSLRKIERDEVMKNVLRWLFGPTFEFVPPDIPEELYDPESKAVKQYVWSEVLNAGEIIKFLHHAIEWENMLYFLYPYFWSHIHRWEFKKYLDHPDFMHRVFLKSGSARVVLTIRPGFEKDFLTFLENGDSSPLPEGHPYLTIAQEMENYAKTNYPGIRPANPVEDARPLIYPKQKRAWKDMQIIMTFLDLYAAGNDGKYPSALADLKSIFPLKDPWGNNYVYTSPGLQGDYDLVSYGADDAPGGMDENMDITGKEDVNSLSYPKQKKAWKDIQIIKTLLNMYVADNNGRYPPTLADLRSVLKLKDPWENNYVYTSPGLYGEYDLVSYGADGKPGGTEENADITSWAEATLIGTWNEYTPTSAMDIAFDEAMPNA